MSRFFETIGYFGLPIVERCQVFSTANDQLAVVSGVSTPLTWDTEVVDVGDMFNIAAPSLIRFPSAGLYLCYAQIAWADVGQAESGIRQAHLRLTSTNGIFVQNRGRPFLAVQGANSFMVCSGLFQATAGDSFAAEGFHTFGAPLAYAKGAQTVSYAGAARIR